MVDILIIFSLVLLVAGVVFVIKGLNALVDDEFIVSISDMNDIQPLKKDVPVVQGFNQDPVSEATEPDNSQSRPNRLSLNPIKENELKKQGQESITEDNKRVTALEEKIEALIKSDESNLDKIKQLEQRESENKELLDAKFYLETKLAKIKELNEQLLEDEKMLRYELTKSKAQALGLQKVCDDLKEKFDQKSTVE